MKNTNLSLESRPKTSSIGAMKLLCAFAVWIGMGAIIGAGILMAVKGSLWLLIASLIVFVIAVGKIGCATH